MVVLYIHMLRIQNVAKIEIQSQCIRERVFSMKIYYKSGLAFDPSI